MSDIISRQAAIEHLKKRLYETALNNITEHPYYEEIADNRVDVWMNELPSAERKGKWIPQKDKWGDCVITTDGYICSECGNFDCMIENYCPNCGARMERGEEDG